MQMISQDEAKILAAKTAIERFVKNGMKIGLGSGTTAHFFVRSLAEKMRKGMKVTATSTSPSTTEVAEKAGIKITDINDIGKLDLTIDGADEIDRQFRMIKGGGACMLREKIIAHASKKMIAICDETKLVDKLGSFPLPVEVVPFGWMQTRSSIENLLPQFCASASVHRREKNNRAVITADQNYLLDCRCGAITEPEALELQLNAIAGVVENGLFNREADGMVVAMFDGSTRILLRR